jgi:hypothetical protein
LQIPKTGAYQTITLPSYATDIKLSFYYHLFTEDSVGFDWVEVYVRDSSGNNLEQIFKKGGVNYPGLEEYGWEQVTYDLSAYAGKTIQIYFAVANWYDTLYKTWCYIDDVSVTYTTCNFWCRYITVCSMILKLLLIARLGVLGASWPPRSLILHAGYA